MPLDPSIISGVQITANQTPVDYAQAAEKTTTALDTARQTIQNARDDAAIRQAFAQASQNGPADPNDVVNTLMGVAPSAAMKLKTEIGNQQKTLAEAEKTRLESLTTRMTLASQAMRHAQDNPDDPNAYPLAKGVVESLTGAKLPDQADPSVIGQIVDQGTTAANAIRAKNNAVDALLKSQQTQSGWLKSASQAFSLAQSPDDWAATGSHLYALGVPKAVIAQFGPWSADAPKKAGELGMTPNERATAAHDQALESQATTKSVLLDGKPAEVRVNKQGQFIDDTGTVIPSSRVRPIPPAASAGASGTDAHDIAMAIARGDQPPVTTGLYRDAAPVRAELGRMGFDLSKANEDWTATQKYLGTLNGTQQTRLRQAVNFANSSLDLVDGLAQQWDGSTVKPLNAANLALAEQGLLGQRAKSLAVRLDAQIADLQSELGTVYKGGNSSTDESLALAAKNLQADWDAKTLKEATQQIRTNLTIRNNSLKLGGIAGVGGSNAYAPKDAPAAAPIKPALIYDPKTGTFKPGGGD